MQNVVSKLWWISENCGAAKTFKAPQKCFFSKIILKIVLKFVFLCVYICVFLSVMMYIFQYLKQTTKLQNYYEL